MTPLNLFQVGFPVYQVVAETYAEALRIVEKHATMDNYLAEYNGEFYFSQENALSVVPEDLIYAGVAEALIVEAPAE